MQIGPSIISWGTDDQKARWLPGILDASEHWCQGFSEPQAGSDLANLRTTAILSDDGTHYVVNGQKTWISSAQIAKWGLFLMRTDPTAIARGRKHEGITTFIVDMELPGIDIRPIREITGDSLFCEVFFNDVKIPVGDRLGDEGNGWLVSMGALGQERVGSAGQAISMAQDLRTLLQTAKAENPDALRDPAIRERVAELHMQIDFTRLLIARALSKVLKGEKGWPEVPLAKLQWGYISLWLAELALDVLGPTGALLKGAPGRGRRRHVGPQLRVAALHDDRRRPHRGPEEHHRRPRPQARTLTPARNAQSDWAISGPESTPASHGSDRDAFWKRAGEKGWRSRAGSRPATRSATSFPEIGPSRRPLAPWPVATNTLSTPGERTEQRRVVEARRAQAHAHLAERRARRVRASPAAPRA